MPGRRPGQREAFRGGSLQSSADVSPSPAPPAFPSSDPPGQGSRAETDPPGEPASLGLEAAEPVLPGRWTAVWGLPSSTRRLASDPCLELGTSMPHDLPPRCRVRPPQGPGGAPGPARFPASAGPGPGGGFTKPSFRQPEIRRAKKHDHLHNRNGVDESSSHWHRGCHASWPPSYLHSSWTAPGGLFSPTSQARKLRLRMRRA